MFIQVLCSFFNRIVDGWFLLLFCIDFDFAMELNDFLIYLIRGQYPEDCFCLEHSRSCSPLLERSNLSSGQQAHISMDGFTLLS